MENDRRLLNYFDCHLHTKSSHDSTEEHSSIIKHALEEGLAGYMVTDPVDILRAEGEAFLSPAYDSFENYSRLVSSGYEGTLAEVKGNEAPLLEIRFGVELGDSIRNKKASAKLIADLPFDAVLGSVHKVYIDENDFVFSNYDFKELPKELVRRVVVQYYTDVLKTAEESDIDVLSHLNIINRYEGKFCGGDIEDEVLGPIIRKILGVIIDRGIALEINTSRIGKGMFMPGPEVVRAYKEMGGKLITLGSDAHAGFTAGIGFREAGNMLKEAGFDHACFFRKRKPVLYTV
ncbi:MAG: histidinol-phosphatase HisJ family protein [Clostridia bacterium]|nr:histidinol-phosphatase HisJ family protein [Clostridia bacterium]